MTAASAPFFSLVVATYGRSAELEPLVRSLVGQTCRDFEVIVVDQNRDDRVRPKIAPLEAAGLHVVHLRSDVPSASNARNRGLHRARGRIVVFPDDDCWYEPQTLERAKARFDASPGLHGLAGHWPECEAMEGDARPEVTNDEMRRFRAGNAVCFILFLDRDITTRIGGFDERIGPGHWYAGAEETDLVLSFLASGASMHRAPEVVVHHPNDAELAKKPGRRGLVVVRTRARGTGALYAKHRLEPWIVMRGLVGPFVRAPGIGPIERAAKAYGRLEGFVTWSLTEGAAAVPRLVPATDTKGPQA